jgi:16S rRNA (uracil1498-N3)-methyltransferase
LVLDGNTKLKLFSFYNLAINKKTITDDLYNHLIKSLRFKVGDCFYFFDDEKEYLCQILSIGKDVASYDIQEEHLIIQKNKPFITLIQGYPKGEKIDFICKYATIFNVQEIIFVYMKRSIPKVGDNSHKLKRLQSIILEAVTIAHRRSVPKVSIVNNLKDLDLNSYNSVYLLDENEKTHHQIKKEERIAIIVGPEGGIDDSERQILSKSCTKVSLGENILTTESAALAILALFL